MTSSYSHLDDYIIIRTLGRGITAKVKLVQNSKTQLLYAAKIIKTHTEASSSRLREALLNEVNSLSRIQHPNVVTIVSASTSGVYVKKNEGGIYECMYIVEELCINGELFDIINRTGAFNENVARFYFHQLIAGLECCHNSGITHRDLKAENILFDPNFNLKISDFGFSASILGRDGFLKTKGKNELYMAPEMLTSQPYQGPGVDIFAAGVILFIMTSKDPPFQRAVASDPHYKHLIRKEQRFWQLHKKHQYSDELKSLLEGMLAYNPIERFTLLEIKCHPWFLGACADTQDISQELSERRRHSLEVAERARDLRMKSGSGSGIVFNGSRFYRGDLSESEGLSLSFTIPPDALDVIKIPENFNAVEKYSQILTGLLPNEVMLIISHTLASYEPECETSQDSYDVKVSIITETDSLLFKITLHECPNDLYLVNFKQEEGNQFDFMSIISTIVENVEAANEN
ncbi:unnamed protein product [Blepharisma stoltei]|uniref:non-specific serine/threonine protein kinase n=1 Tax=Blepharisma stoltei TaxID=1481888 RepID=A0AAU9IYQ2_9CILI|nr:unnamed protein product [Blepharisma stoltei]